MMILLCDGQRNVGVDPLQAADALAALNIKVFTIGIGSLHSSPLNRGFTSAMLEELDEGTLQAVAERTGAVSSCASREHARSFAHRVSRHGRDGDDVPPSATPRFIVRYSTCPPSSDGYCPVPLLVESDDLRGRSVAVELSGAQAAAAVAEAQAQDVGCFVTAWHGDARFVMMP